MTTLPPPNGEIPALSAEEIEALKSKSDTVPGKTDDKDLAEIQALTERLLSENLAGGGVEIYETPSTAPHEEEAPPDSMHPERWGMTNRPPSMKDIADIHIALQKKPELTTETNTDATAPDTTAAPEETGPKEEKPVAQQSAFCVEGSED